VLCEMLIEDIHECLLILVGVKKRKAID